MGKSFTKANRRSTRSCIRATSVRPRPRTKRNSTSISGQRPAAEPPLRASPTIHAMNIGVSDGEHNSIRLIPNASPTNEQRRSNATTSSIALYVSRSCGSWEKSSLRVLLGVREVLGKKDFVLSRINLLLTYISKLLTSALNRVVVWMNSYFLPKKFAYFKFLLYLCSRNEKCRILY